jgi:hypothetical protein
MSQKRRKRPIMLARIGFAASDVAALRDKGAVR